MMHESLSAPRKRFYLTVPAFLDCHKEGGCLDNSAHSASLFQQHMIQLLFPLKSWGKLSPVLVWALLFPLLLLLSALRKLLGACLATQYPGNGEGGQDSYSRAVVLEPGSKLTRQIKSFPARRGPLPPTFSLCKILFSRFVVATQV